MNLALDVKNIYKSYAEFQLQDVTLALPRGCIMGLVGENGAGKSTTIQIILDIVHRDRGEVRVLGEDISQVKEQVGVVMDESCFPENLCAPDIDRILKKIYKTWNSEVFLGYCKRFALSEKKSIKDYSRGMKMKLSIAVALSHDSKLLILDEATSGLDPVVRDEILDIFLEFIQDETRSVLISSHIISDLEKICDYITLIHQGKVLFSEQKDLMLERFAMFRGSEEEFKKLPNEAIVGTRRHQFGMEALVRRSMTQAKLESANMEEIMLYMIKEGKSC